MSNNRRFAVDDTDYVIDAVNPANSGKGKYIGVDPEDDGHLREDDRHLRERVLIVRLSGLVEKLIINLRPRSCQRAKNMSPFNEESHSIWMALFYTIRASHLNTFDPTMSIQHKFDGKLRRQKKHTQDSLSLFRDEVECLLRDLYGDVESEALDSSVWAVFRIVEEFTKYVRPDLAKEHRDTEDFDWIRGIGVPEGCGIGRGEFHRGMEAKDNLCRRVREVNANPSAFSEYTREFAKLFAERWDCTKRANGKPNGCRASDRAH